ncbi:hypothetical protein QTP88_002344 [Uroleucon formosanum]
MPDADESGDDLGGPSTSQVSNSEPSSKKKKTTSINSLEEEIIDALHKSVELREEQTKKYEEDADRLFLLSLLKPLKEIPEHLRFSVKMDLMKIINNAQINSHSASLTLSHPQQHNFGNQNVMPYINQDLNTGPRSVYLPNQLHSDPNYQRALQNQLITQRRPTSTIQPYSIRGHFWYVGTGVCLELLFERVCYQLGTVFGRKDKAVGPDQWVRCWTFMKEAFVKFVNGVILLVKRV